MMNKREGRIDRQFVAASRRQIGGLFGGDECHWGSLGAGSAGSRRRQYGRAAVWRSNGTVNIDFNNDTQIDFQIDHDRVNLSGTDLDYLQVDKNDVSSESNPLAIDDFLPDLAPRPFRSTAPIETTTRVLSFTNDFGDSGGYAVALKAGDVIGGSYQ